MIDVLVYVVFLEAIGLASLVLGVRQAILGLRSRRWPVASGRILEVAVDRRAP